ncbi:MAG: hypothetical protein HY973_02060 [Candidatus Kerfeldbacteria bacterium]|nr:hypothetical protein [Candidatus Kerfeldbacteria bacterium]
MSIAPPKFEDFTSKLISWIGSKSSLFIHTLLFGVCIALGWLGVDMQKILLILTTAVSLEAIYLSILIQYSVNQQAHTIKSVAKDIEEVTEDVDELSEDVEEISKDVDEISEDVEEISEDVEEISDNLTNQAGNQTPLANPVTYDTLEHQLKQLLIEVQQLKQQPTVISADPSAAKNKT